MVSLKQLNYAVAVDDERHFKRAAARCSVSQSALSSAVAEMEHQLGVQLFERDNKRVLVTDVGAKVLEKARQILTQVDELQQLTQREQQPLAYPMSVGVIPSIGPYLLPKILPELRRCHPGFKLSIVEERSAPLVERVRKGELDAAIVALPYPLEGLEVREFWTEDFYLVAHQSDSLARRGGVSAADLNQSELLLLQDGHCLRDHALAACRLEIKPRDEALGHTSLYTLVQMVAGRMGTTLVPAMALDQLIHDSSELAAIHLDEPGPHRGIAIVTRRHYSGQHNIDILSALFARQLQAGVAAGQKGESEQSS